MASLFSGVLLLVTLGGIVWEAVRRLLHPKPIGGLEIIIVAAVGVVINTFTALLFIRDQEHDLNIRGAFLHMAADAGVSLGVVIAGVIILLKGWLWVDPVMSLLIVLVILIGTKSLLRDSINYAIDAVPKGIKVEDVKNYLLGLENVDSIHDLHVWPLSTTETALTVHLVLKTDLLDNDFLSNIQEHLHDKFGIEHSTIQIETTKGDNNCMLSEEC